jgi:glycopeptide antibiotics resistance protein
MAGRLIADREIVWILNLKKKDRRKLNRIIIFEFRHFVLSVVGAWVVVFLFMHVWSVKSNPKPRRQR